MLNFLINFETNFYSAKINFLFYFLEKWPMAELQPYFPATVLAKHWTDPFRMTPRKVMNAETDELEFLFLLAKVESQISVIMSSVFHCFIILLLNVLDYYYLLLITISLSRISKYLK